MTDNRNIHFCKANAELQLQILRLWQESSRHWLDAIQQCYTNSLQETNSRIQGLNQANDWQTLANLPLVAFGRLTEGRVSDGQAFSQAAIQSQTAFSDGLRKALATWQATASGVIGGSDDTMSQNRVRK